MEIAKITVQRNTLQITQFCSVTRGMVGSTVIFEEFGPEWDGLSKTAVFRNGSKTRDVVNVQAGEPVAIPWEVLDMVLADLMVGICGTNADGSLVIATVWGTLGQIAPGANPEGRPSEPPTPDWTQQIEGQVNKAIEEAQAVRPLAEKAAADAAASANSAKAAGDSCNAAQQYAEFSNQNLNDTIRGAQQAGQMAREAAGHAETAGQALNAAKAEVCKAADAQAAAAGSAGSARQSSAAAADNAERAGKEADRAKAEADRAAYPLSQSAPSVLCAKQGKIIRYENVSPLCAGIQCTTAPGAVVYQRGRQGMDHRLLGRRCLEGGNLLIDTTTAGTTVKGTTEGGMFSIANKSFPYFCETGVVSITLDKALPCGLQIILGGGPATRYLLISPGATFGTFDVAQGLYTGCDAYFYDVPAGPIDISVKIMLGDGTGPEPYEPFRGGKFEADGDGNVNGLAVPSPYMLLTSDSAVECECQTFLTEKTPTTVYPALEQGSNKNILNKEAVAMSRILPTRGVRYVNCRIAKELETGASWEILGYSYNVASGSVHTVPKEQEHGHYPWIVTDRKDFILDVSGYPGFALIISQCRQDGTHVVLKPDEIGLEIRYVYEGLPDADLTLRTDGFALPDAARKANCQDYCAEIAHASEETETFLFFTDPHPFTLSTEAEIGRLLAPISEVYSHTPSNFCLCGGDWLTENDTKDEAAYKLGEIDGYMRKNYPNYVPVLGNHDGNALGGEPLTHAAVKALFFGREQSAYYKYPAPATTVYVLDSNTAYDGMDAYLWGQIDWLAKSLKSDDPEHSFAAVHVIRSVQAAPAFTDHYTKIIQAYNTRANISLNGQTYDFAGCRGTCHFVIGGHEHEDWDGVINGVPLIITTQVKDGTDTAKWPTFDLCLADYGKHILHMVRVGNGANRDIVIA